MLQLQVGPARRNIQGAKIAPKSVKHTTQRDDAETRRSAGAETKSGVAQGAHRGVLRQASTNAVPPNFVGKLELVGGAEAHKAWGSGASQRGCACELFRDSACHCCVRVNQAAATIPSCAEQGQRCFAVALGTAQSSLANTFENRV